DPGPNRHLPGGDGLRLLGVPVCLHGLHDARRLAHRPLRSVGGAGGDGLRLGPPGRPHRGGGAAGARGRGVGPAGAPGDPLGEAERRWIAAARPSPPTPLPAGERGEEYSPVPLRRPVEERAGNSPVPAMPSGVRADVAAPGWQALLGNHRLILLTLSYAAVG